MARVPGRIVLGVALLCVSAVSLAFAVSGPPIVLRTAWKAPDPVLKRDPPVKEVTQGPKRILSENELKPRDIGQLELLTVHSSGIPSSPAGDVSGKMKSLQTMVQKGYQVTPGVFSYMAEIPYHYVILRDGQVDGKIAEGRELKYPAATNTRDSEYGRTIARHLTVVVELKYTKANGNLVALPPSAAQLKSLEDLLEHLATKHKISATKIGYHQQYAQTACPGPALISETKRIRAALIAKGL
jgi:hypothetical protein